MSVRQTFLDLFRRSRAARLAAIDQLVARATLDDDHAQAAALKGERRSLLDFPATLAPTEDRAALVAAWPAGIAALPLWFTDPDEAARLDPPGDPVVVDCRDVAQAAAPGLELDPDPPSIDTVRGWRADFARREYDDAIALLDREARKLPQHRRGELLPLRQQAEARRAARLAAIAAAATVADLADL